MHFLSCQFMSLVIARTEAQMHRSAYFLIYLKISKFISNQYEAISKSQGKNFFYRSSRLARKCQKWIFKVKIKQILNLEKSTSTAEVSATGVDLLFQYNLVSFKSQAVSVKGSLVRVKIKEQQIQEPVFSVFPNLELFSL